MTERPRVTIIATFYNSGAFAQTCLEQLASLEPSIAAAGHQLILVDDCSPDGTFEVLQGCTFASKVIRNQVNLGQGAARNRALQHATGDYLWFVDHDDEWHPSILQRLLEGADGAGVPGGAGAGSGPDIAVCGASYLRAEDRSLIEVLEAPASAELMNQVQAVQSMVRGELQGYIWNKLIRRNLVAADAFPAQDAHGDLEMFIRALAQAESVARVPSDLYTHLDHPSSMTRSRNPNLSQYESCHEFVAQLAVRIGAFSADAAELRRYEYYQFIGPAIGTMLSSGAGHPTSAGLLGRARSRSRLRDLPGVYRSFPVPALLALGFKLFGMRLALVYRAIQFLRVLPRSR